MKAEMSNKRPTIVVLPLAAMLACGMAAAAEGSFYKDPGIFSTRPDEKKSSQSIDRFGPVGMGIELVQPAFAMKIKNIEEGSPAAATGKLKAGQMIETINGQKLADIDPRIQLGQVVTAAEATDGVVKFMVKDQADAAAEEVIVRIPVLGAYNKTWPRNCPKSDKIVRNFADYLAQPGSDHGFGGIGMLFLLSTGEEKDLEVVRRWAGGLKGAGYNWHIGIGGIPLTEYYLRTGDESVLPTIKTWVDAVAGRQYLGGWAGRGDLAAVTYGGGGGHLNAGGTAVVTFLMLAKECGVDVPDHTLHSALTHFYRYTGRGVNPYGNGRPETGFVDNGKTGNVALAMAAAASLTPNGEQSIYAGARDAAAMTSFYTTTFMLHGHTGGGIGELWRSAAMGLLHEKAPAKYREFMDQRKWHYELSRRWDGSFAILGGAGYDNTSWGAGYALAYTMPRKTLRITGAPKTKFVHEYQLPERPWGNKADDVFVSIEAVPDKDGRRQDLSNETLAQDSSMPVVRRLSEPDGVSDEMIRQYAHHQDHEIRKLATRRIIGAISGYIGWKSRGGPVRVELMVELLREKDPRVRQAAIDGLIYGLTLDKRDAEAGFTIDVRTYFTQEIFDLLIGMIKDPDESWWVKDHALRALRFATADMVAPHVGVLIPYLKHEEWWLQNAALIALTPVVADERCYQKVLPAIGELLRTCQIWNATTGPMQGIRAKISEDGSPEAKRCASAAFKGAYTDYAGTRQAPGGLDITKAHDSQVKFLAETLAGVPGGYDLLYKIAKERFPNDPLPYSAIFLSADFEQFGPELKQAIKPLIRDHMIPAFVGENRRGLQGEIERKKNGVHLEGTVDKLAELYRKIGINEYDWHDFGPDLRNQEWNYYTFDPKEKQAYDVSPWRYRKVTYPQGMENWYAVDFTPGDAGWKTGLPPFGQLEGKLMTNEEHCSNPDCRCKDTMRTLWDQEVLLVRETFKVPPLKPGHLYRLRNGQGQHVGSGSGFRVYINGKLLIEEKAGNGKRVGGKPRGSFITSAFVEELKKGEVTIAATAFLRYGSKAIVTMPPVPQGRFSIWLEEMKIPPLGEDMIRKSAAAVPMLCSQWQALQDPDNHDLQPEEGMFRYDGKFVANPDVLGGWKTIDQVKSMDEFTPGKEPAKIDSRRVPFMGMTFKDQGKTGDPLWIWSGDTLMDLDKYQALKMTLRKIADTEYLFIESGGFSQKNPQGWKPPLYVMKRD